MAFLLTVLFMIASYLRPGDLSVELSALRIPFWVGNFGMVAGSAGTLFGGRTSVWKAPQLHFLLGFVGVLVLSPILARHWVGGALDAFSTFSTAVIGYVLIVFAVDTISKLRILAILLAVLSIALVIQGGLAVHVGIGRDLFILSQNVENPDGQALDRVRALGYLNDPNDLAQALIAAAPLLWPFWQAGRRMRNFFAVMLPSLVLLYGVFLTHSRGAAASIVIIVGLLAREKMQRFRKTAPVVLAVVMLAAFSLAGLSGGRDVSSGDESAAGRLDAWSAGFEMLKSNPLVGVGYGAFTDFNPLTAHNSFVLCFSELGLAGYFFWFGLLVVAIWELRHVDAAAADHEEYSDLRDWALAARFSLYALLSGAFFLSRTYAPTLYVSLAIAFVVVDMARREGFPEIPRGSMLFRVGGLTIASVTALYCVVRVGHLWMH